MVRLTSRDRSKSAPYPRLKNSKRTSKCQFTVLENRKAKKMDRVARRGPVARAPGALKRKKIRKKVSQCRKTERGSLWGFSTSILSQNSKKIEGGTLWEFFFQKSLAVPKKIEMGSRPVWYVTRENRKNLFGSVR